MERDYLASRLAPRTLKLQGKPSGSKVIIIHGSRAIPHTCRVKLHNSKVTLHGSRVKLHVSRVSLQVNLHVYKIQDTTYSMTPG
jgi:hypothetical protein